MSRLVDIELAEEWMNREEHWTPDERWRPEREFCAMLDALPTVDAEPVRHAYWKLISTRKNKYNFRFLYKCSDCGRLIQIYSEEPLQMADIYPYCHCGAKMDGKENENGKSSM